MEKILIEIFYKKPVHKLLGIFIIVPQITKTRQL